MPCRSLHALKQCVRAFSERTRTGKPVRIPFRDALLTRLLADSFQGAGSLGSGSLGSGSLGCGSFGSGSFGAGSFGSGSFGLGPQGGGSLRSGSFESGSLGSGPHSSGLEGSGPSGSGLQGSGPQGAGPLGSVGEAPPSGWSGPLPCRLAVLGCVSPASAATEHSVSTLRTVMELACGEVFNYIYVRVYN